MWYILRIFFALRALAEPNSWQEITPVGSVPTPKRINHMVMWSEVDDGFYVYGGRDENYALKMICTSIQGKPILGQKLCPMAQCPHGKLRQLCGATKLMGSTFLEDAAGRMTYISIPGSPIPGKSFHLLAPYHLDEKGTHQCGGMSQMVSTCAEATRAILESLWIWLFTLEPPMRGSGFGPQVPRQMPATTTPWYGVKLMTDSISLEVIPASRKTMEETGALFKEMICISTRGRQTRGKNWSLAACHTSMDCIGRRLFLHAERSTQLYGANKMTDSMFLEAIPTATT